MTRWPSGTPRRSSVVHALDECLMWFRFGPLDVTAVAMVFNRLVSCCRGVGPQCKVDGMGIRKILEIS